jgi:hypothetical protein
MEQGRRDYDGEFASRLLGAVESSSSRPTNWNQVYPGLQPEAWIRWEQRFLEYPEAQRGFRKSLYEKYVFIQPCVRVPDWNGMRGGDLAMLQVNPPKGQTRRYAIWRADTGYQICPFPESEIQKWFAKAERPAPTTPPENLPPATPADWKPEAESAGFWLLKGLPLGILLCSILTVAFGLVFLRFRRRIT